MATAAAQLPPPVTRLDQLTPEEGSRANTINEANARAINGRSDLEPHQKEALIQELTRRTNQTALARLFYREAVNIAVCGINLEIASKETLCRTFTKEDSWGLTTTPKMESYAEYQERLMLYLSACRHNGEDTSIADIIEHIGNGEYGSAARDVWESEIVQDAIETIGEGILRDE